MLCGKVQSVSKQVKFRFPWQRLPPPPSPFASPFRGGSWKWGGSVGFKPGKTSPPLGNSCTPHPHPSGPHSLNLTSFTNDYASFNTIFSQHWGTSIRTPVLCIYLLKQKRVNVPDEIHESYPGKNIYRKDPKFLTDQLDKQCKLRSAYSLGIRLIRVYILWPFRLHIVEKPQ